MDVHHRLGKLKVQPKREEGAHPGHARLRAHIDDSSASLLLIIVALSQLWLAWQASLTPWKGGGFGMFSVIDAPSMRVIRVTGRDADGNEFRIMPGSAPHSRALDRLRNLPSSKTLRVLGEELLQSELVPVAATFESTLAQLQRDNPHVELEWDTTLNAHGLAFRPRHADDPRTFAQITRVVAVRLQLWRLRHDRERNRLFLEPLGNSVQLGDWG
jgi:hypothetical protein